MSLVTETYKKVTLECEKMNILRASNIANHPETLGISGHPCDEFGSGAVQALEAAPEAPPAVGMPGIPALAFCQLLPHFAMDKWPKTGMDSL